MATPTTLLDHFQGHLVGQGIVRDPRTAGVLAPCYKQPRVGTPAPGDVKGVESNQDAVMAVFRMPGIPVGPYESWYRRDCVRVVYRLRDARLIDALELQVRGEFADRRAWETTTGLYIIESLVLAELGLVASDEKVYTYQEEFTLQLYTGLGPRG